MAKIILVLLMVAGLPVPSPAGQTSTVAQSNKTLVVYRPVKATATLDVEDCSTTKFFQDQPSALADKPTARAVEKFAGIFDSELFDELNQAHLISKGDDFDVVIKSRVKQFEFSQLFGNSPQMMMYHFWSALFEVMAVDAKSNKPLFKFFVGGRTMKNEVRGAAQEAATIIQGVIDGHLKTAVHDDDWPDDK